MKLETYESDFLFFFNKKGKNFIGITCFTIPWKILIKR